MFVKTRKENENENIDGVNLPRSTWQDWEKNRFLA